MMVGVTIFSLREAYMFEKMLVRMTVSSSEMEVSLRKLYLLFERKRIFQTFATSRDAEDGVFFLLNVVSCV